MKNVTTSYCICGIVDARISRESACVCVCMRACKFSRARLFGFRLNFWHLLPGKKFIRASFRWVNWQRKDGISRQRSLLCKISNLIPYFFTSFTICGPLVLDLMRRLIVNLFVLLSFLLHLTTHPLIQPRYLQSLHLSFQFVDLILSYLSFPNPSHNVFAIKPIFKSIFWRRMSRHSPLQL